MTQKNEMCLARGRDDKKYIGIQESKRKALEQNKTSKI